MKQINIDYTNGAVLYFYHENRETIIKTIVTDANTCTIDMPEEAWNRNRYGSWVALEDVMCHPHANTPQAVIAQIYEARAKEIAHEIILLLDKTSKTFPETPRVLSISSSRLSLD